MNEQDVNVIKQKYLDAITDLFAITFDIGIKCNGPLIIYGDTSSGKSSLVNCLKNIMLTNELDCYLVNYRDTNSIKDIITEYRTKIDSLKSDFRKGNVTSMYSLEMIDLLNNIDEKTDLQLENDSLKEFIPCILFIEDLHKYYTEDSSYNAYITDELIKLAHDGKDVGITFVFTTQNLDNDDLFRLFESMDNKLILGNIPTSNTRNLDKYCIDKRIVRGRFVGVLSDIYNDKYLINLNQIPDLYPTYFENFESIY